MLVRSATQGQTSILQGRGKAGKQREGVYVGAADVYTPRFCSSVEVRINTGDNRYDTRGSRVKCWVQRL